LPDYRPLDCLFNAYHIGSARPRRELHWIWQHTVGTVAAAAARRTRVVTNEIDAARRTTVCAVASGAEA
jgi:hypothetical protein